MRTLMLTLVLLSSVGCATRPVVRNLGIDPLPVQHAALPSRECRLALLPLDDRRPQAEREGDAPRTIKVLVPLGLLIVWSTEGIEAADPEHLGGPMLLAEMEAGIRTVVDRSGVCALVADPAQATHTLEVTLEHLYGLNPYRYTLLAGPGASSESSTEFYPSGYASLSFVLRSGAATAEFRLSGSRLFDPSAPGSDSHYSPEGLQAHQVEDNRTQQVVAAMTTVYEKLPPALDRALASLGAEAQPSTGETAFVIVRQLDDLEHVEQATIDYESGHVRHVGVYRRVTPLFSAPGEWVVSPYQPSMLTAAAYRRLIEHLSKRYVITWDENLSAAVFGGLREEPQTVATTPVEARGVVPRRPQERHKPSRRPGRLAMRR